MISVRTKRYLVTAALLSSLAWLAITVFMAKVSSTPINIFTTSALFSFFQFVGNGILLLGLVPLLIGTFMSFMASRSSALDMVNEVALVVALASIFMGVLFALAAIYGSTNFTKHLLTCIVLFVGSACTLCTLKFFYTNRSTD